MFLQIESYIHTIHIYAYPQIQTCLILGNCGFGFSHFWLQPSLSCVAHKNNHSNDKQEMFPTIDGCTQCKKIWNWWSSAISHRYNIDTGLQHFRFLKGEKNDKLYGLQANNKCTNAGHTSANRKASLEVQSWTCLKSGDTSWNAKSAQCQPQFKLVIWYFLLCGCHRWKDLSSLIFFFKHQHYWK